MSFYMNNIPPFLTIWHNYSLTSSFSCTGFHYTLCATTTTHYYKTCNTTLKNIFFFSWFFFFSFRDEGKSCDLRPQPWGSSIQWSFHFRDLLFGFSPHAPSFIERVQHWMSLPENTLVGNCVWDAASSDLLSKRDSVVEFIENI